MQKIGKKLYEKRIELGLSIDDISDKTRLTTKHIKALEEGDLSFFHEDLSYLRYFVKSYCAAVGLDFEDFKDDLQTSINEYTKSFAKSEQLTHDAIEENIANSDKLSRVETVDMNMKKRRTYLTNKANSLKKTDVSLVSLVAIIGVVAIFMMFAFILFVRDDKPESVKPQDIPIVEENDKNDDSYLSDKDKEEQVEDVKELEIVSDSTVDYTLNNLKANDKVVIETTFNGARSGYSVTVDGKETLDSKVYQIGETVKTEVEVKKGTKISLYIGCMVQTDIKVNDVVVKTDSSINPSTWPGQCPSNTITFTIGEVYESAK